jgi:hypothetical protein
MRHSVFASLVTTLIRGAHGSDLAIAPVQPVHGLDGTFRLRSV